MQEGKYIYLTDNILIEAAHEVDRAMLAMLPEPSECRHVFSKSFERKMQKIIRRADHFIAYKVLRYAACIFISFVMAASMFLAVNTEARAAVVNWIKENFKGVYHYFFVTEDSAEEHEAYTTGWVPEGYKLVGSFKTVDGESHIYLDNIGNVLQFAYVYGSDSTSITAGRGEYAQKHVSEGNFRAELFISLTDNEANAIMWSEGNGTIMCTISGFIDEEALVKMAKSVASQ